jgi:hypothetical protein
MFDSDWRALSDVMVFHRWFHGSRVMRIFQLSMIVLLFLMVGCNIFPKRVEQPVHYYDIGAPVRKNELKINLKLSSVNSLFSERTQMVFKDGG